MSSRTRATKAKPSRVRKGRPTVEESLQLDEDIKSSALDHFLQHGFDTATMNNIARDAGITKRTLYARYTDKETLFMQVLTWAMRQPGETHQNALLEDNLSLEEKLTRLAESILRHELNIKVVQLSRIATFLIDRFPSIPAPDQFMSGSPRMKTLSAILTHHAEQGEIIVEDVALTAELFISLIGGIPARLAAFGVFREPEFEQQRIREAVRIFLKGISAPH